MMLRELAHARAGDKGDTCNISVIAFDGVPYAHIAEHVTVAAVRDRLIDFVRGEVVRLSNVSPK